MIYWVVGLLVVATFLYYWLIILTEGVFLGRRLVVWLYDITAYRYDGIKAYEMEDEEVLIVEPVLAGTRTVAPCLLDVATGTGRVPYFLLADGRFKGEIVAVDASQKMLDYAKERLVKLPDEQQSRVELAQYPAVPLPYPDESFDIVTSLEALEFFPNDKAALQEMVRVLRGGGFLMVTRRREWEGWTFLWRYRSRERMKRLVENCGVSRVQVLNWQSNYDLVVGYKR